MSTEIYRISTQTGNLFNECSNDYEYLLGCFTHLHDCGFEAIDYNIDHFLDGTAIVNGELNDFWDKSLDELYEYFTPTKNAVHDSGLVFSQTHASFPVYMEGKDKINDYMIMVTKKTLAVCKFLGCPALVVHPFFGKDYHKETEINLNIYRKLIPAAKEYGVTVCLENGYAEIETHCMLIDKLNAEAGAKCFGYCLDIGHANNCGGLFKKYIVMLGDRLTCLHIHDNDGVNDSHMIPYTQTRGYKIKCTDYDGMLAGLREIGYRGNLSFEAFRGFEALPKEVESEALKLVSAIGRYWRSKLING